MTLPDRHLDLGCGGLPRNPYQRAQLCGVDILALAEAPGFDYRAANLSVEPIPFGDNVFGSVSAFDFIEHVPRILPAAGQPGTRFPFIELMNEIWRVLAPGGRFYALTPAYPHAEAFTDPTHVNIVTARTHEYFCGHEAPARVYGFTGRFRALDVHWTLRGDAYGAIRGSAQNYSGTKRMARKLRAFSRMLRGKQATAKPPYLLWELEAEKPRVVHAAARPLDAVPHAQRSPRQRHPVDSFSLAPSPHLSALPARGILSNKTRPCAVSVQTTLRAMNGKILLRTLA